MPVEGPRVIDVSAILAGPLCCQLLGDYGAGVAGDEHIRAAGMITEASDPGLEPMLMRNVMWRMSKTPGRIRCTGRPPGAGTGSVLTGLGYRADEPARLREQGVIR